MLDEGRRCKILMLDQRELIDILEGRKVVCNIPKDATVEYVFADPAYHGIGIYFHSETFPPVPVGNAAPVMAAELAKTQTVTGS